MKTKLSIMAALLAAFSTAPSAAQPDCVLTVESAAYVVDVSGSMMEKLSVRAGEAPSREAQKILLVREALEEINALAQKRETLPTSLFTVAPYTNRLPLAERPVETFGQALEKLNPKLEVFGRPTWVGERAQSRFNEAVGRPQTVILFTDGGFSKEHHDPVEVLKDFYTANPQSCIHFVSLARTDAQKAGVESLAGLKACSKTIAVEDLLAQRTALERFVASVFPEECREPEKAPAVTFKGVNFDFDKSTLTPEAKKLLNRALEVIRDRPAGEHIRIVGWTDWYGSDAYNAGLSKRRAAAVKAYLVLHGVDAARIEEVGSGKSFRYTNETTHGRWLNRRVDLILSDSALVSEDAR